MAKKVVQMDVPEGNGKVVIYSPTKAQRKGESAGLIPKTPAPQTRWQRFVRDAIG